MELSFGEQVKIVLRRKGLTIKELAEEIEQQTGMKMSRQNLTQRLMRDNFQERDMRMIAAVLGCKMSLSIMDEEESAPAPVHGTVKEEPAVVVTPVSVPVSEPVVEPIVEPVAEEVAETPEEAEARRLAEEAALRAEEERRQAEETRKAEEARQEEERRLAEEEAARREAEEAIRLAEEESLRQEEERRAAQSAEERDRQTAEEQERERIRNIAQRAVAASQKSENSFLGNNRIDYLARQQKQKKANKAAQKAAEKSKNEGESLVQAAKKDAERQAVLSNTADMGVIPDSFRSVPRNAEPKEESPAINPRTGEEYESNVVRNHPRLKGYIQVYDRGEHRWIDMTEWAFLGFQERKKVMLGVDYKPPIYLD